MEFKVHYKPSEVDYIDLKVSRDEFLLIRTYLFEKKREIEGIGLVCSSLFARLETQFCRIYDNFLGPPND
jgi:hypothetical protein